jgi:hypothetical protein
MKHTTRWEAWIYFYNNIIMHWLVLVPVIQWHFVVSHLVLCRRSKLSGVKQAWRVACMFIITYENVRRGDSEYVPFKLLCIHYM